MAGDLLRGVVSLVGVVTVIAGLIDLRAALAPWFSGPAAEAGDDGRS